MTLFKQHLHHTFGGQFALVHVNLQREKYKQPIFVEISGIDKSAALSDAVKEIGLLARSDLFIGSMYSNWGRISLQLSSAVCVKSTEALWCPFTSCHEGRRDRGFCSHGAKVLMIPDKGEVAAHCAPEARKSYFEALRRWRRNEMENGLQQLCEEAMDDSMPLLF